VVKEKVLAHALQLITPAQQFCDMLNFVNVFSRGLYTQKSLNLKELICVYLVLFIVTDTAFIKIAAVGLIKSRLVRKILFSAH
jgi:hypothetical protein